MAPRVNEDALWEGVRHYEAAAQHTETVRDNLDHLIEEYINDRMTTAENSTHPLRDFLHGLYCLTFARWLDPLLYECSWKAFRILLKQKKEAREAAKEASK